MELALVNKPPYFNLTGNFQVFDIYIVPYFEAAQELGFRLNVTIEVETIRGSGIYQEARQFVLFPSRDGKFKFDVSPIIATYGKQYIPTPSLNNMVVCESHIVSYRVKATLTDDVKIIDTIAESYHVAMLGGLPLEEYIPGRFIEQWVDIKKQFLKYHTSQEPAYLDQPNYLFFLTQNSDSFTPTFKVHLSDDSEVTTTLPTIITTGPYKVLCIPIGFTILNLQSLYPDHLRPVWYEVSVIIPSGLHCNPVRFYFDHRNYYNPVDILYPNSLGGIDVIRLRGTIDREVDVNQVKSESVNIGTFYGNIVSHTLNNFYLSEREIIKVDTGFISKSMVTRLRDIFLQREVFEINGGRLKPIEINARNVKLYSSTDFLYNLALEYRYGYENTHWSTRNVLQIEGGSCPAVAFGYAYRKNADLVEVIYALPPGYNLVEFSFDTFDPTSSSTISGNTGRVNLEKPYVVPPEGVDLERYVFARVICNPDSDPIDAGPWLTITYIEILENRLIVGNDTLEVPYGLSAPLELSANILDNDYDETGAAITAQVAVAAATEKGGTVSITAAGVVTYEPSSSSFIGTDSYVYTVLVAGGGIGTGTIYFVVGNPEVGNVIFVKLATENITTYNGLRGLRPVQETRGEVFVYFYKDFAATQPIDVRNLGLVINVRQRVTDYDDGSPTITDTTLPTDAVRTKTKVYGGLLYRDYVDGDDYIQYEFSILSGTGYQEI